MTTWAPCRTAHAELPIAVFDSGVGGLTVLHECLVSLPHEDFVYLGDTARFPYGPRSREELEAFALELARILLADGAKLLVVACNSATAAALPALRRELGGEVGIVSVVGPESRLAARATRNGEVGLLATQATVASGAYEDALAEANRDARLHPVPCPRARTADPGGRRGRRARRGAGGGVLRSAPGSRCRHRDPRLHPLSAGQRRCSSVASAAA